MSHVFERVLMAVISGQKPTVQAVGVAYALCIAARPVFQSDDWSRIHGAIADVFDCDNTSQWVRLLDKIKKEGWRVYDLLVAENVADLPPTDAPGVEG